MALATAFPKAFGIWFRAVDRWIAPKRQFWAAALPKGWSIVQVSELVKQVVERVRVEKDKEYRLIGVKWYGEGTFYREMVRGDSISATYLTPVIPNTFIYNRLFAWKESFAVVPDEHEGHFVSGEFPQFIVDEGRLLPRYLYLFFMLDTTIREVNAASVGSAAVSRNRFKEEEFLNFEIPLPPLATQRAIVARWEEARSERATAEERLSNREKELIDHLRHALGRTQKNTTQQRKVFTLPWVDLERWGVQIAWAMKTQSHTRLYPTVLISELCKISSGGTPSRKITAYFGGEIPWVKTAEVRGGVITETEESLSKLGLQNSSAKIYPKGSLIVAMYGQGATRGRTAKLGVDAATNQACAVLTEISPQVKIDFLWFYLMSEYNNLRELASGNNQPNLNAAMIANYSVPLPPLDVQRELMNNIEMGRAKIAREREEAARRFREAEAKLEALILGTEHL